LKLETNHNLLRSITDHSFHGDHGYKLQHKTSHLLVQVLQIKLCAVYLFWTCLTTFFFTCSSVKLRISISILCSHPVRRASANVVSIIAKYAIPAGEWPELLPFLFQCSQSPQEDHREVSLS
jgi:hypothetical protein